MARATRTVSRDSRPGRQRAELPSDTVEFQTGGHTMEGRQVVITPSVPRHSPSYAHAVVANGFVFCSGQVGEDATGRIVLGDTYDQAKRALHNLETILRAAGSSLEAAVKLTVFLTDWDRDLPLVRRALDERFAASPPTRSTVQVARVALGGLVEIDAVAKVLSIRRPQAGAKGKRR